MSAWEIHPFWVGKFFAFWRCPACGLIWYGAMLPSAFCYRCEP